MTEVYIFQFSTQNSDRTFRFRTIFSPFLRFHHCGWICIFLCRSRAVRRRSSDQLSVQRPAGPAQCSPPSGTPSGHISAGTRVRGQHNKGEKGHTNYIEVSAVQKKKKKSTVEVQVLIFLVPD